jgi:hypothetical protein
MRIQHGVGCLALAACLLLAGTANAMSVTLTLDRLAECSGFFEDCAFTRLDQPLGFVTYEDGIINTKAGQPGQVPGLVGVRITIASAVPMSQFMFGTPVPDCGVAGYSAGNDFVIDGVAFPVTQMDHIGPGGEFFSCGHNGAVSPFGWSNNRLLGVDWNHTLQFDVFSFQADDVVTLSDVLGLSSDCPPEICFFPLQSPLHVAAVARLEPGFRGDVLIERWIGGRVLWPPAILLMVVAVAALVTAARFRSG